VPPPCPQARNASTSINGSEAFTQLNGVEPRGLEPLTPTLPVRFSRPKATRSDAHQLLLCLWQNDFLCQLMSLDVGLSAYIR